MTERQHSNRSRFLAMLLLADLGLGLFFGGLAVSSASAAEGEDTVEVSPTAEPTSEPTPEPTPEVTPEPVAAQVSLIPTVDADGSMTIGWLDTVRDENALNYPLFQNLQVTVSQVQDLTYQAVSVEWTGGVETTPRELAANYLR